LHAWYVGKPDGTFYTAVLIIKYGSIPDNAKRLTITNPIEMVTNEQKRRICVCFAISFFLIILWTLNERPTHKIGIRKKK